jgi:DNA polymerase-3 subunit delta'
LSFKDIRLQDRAVSFLSGSADKGRLPHSLLFYGPDGVGKTLTAVTLAKRLNCDSTSGGDPCDTCPSCRKIEGLNHPDVHWIAPEGPGSKIRIERIREMKERINLKPFESRCKIFILEKAHSLAAEGANSLLKTLEEPPGDAVIILLTDDLNKIFGTIRSRCQWVVFPSAEPARLERLLVDERGFTEREARLLSRLSGGRIGKALSMRDGRAIGWRNEALGRFSPENVILHEDPFFFDKKRENILEAVDVLISWYRDAYILASGGDGALCVNTDRIEDVASIARSLPVDTLSGILEDLLKARRHIEGNVNPKFVLCDLVCGVEEKLEGVKNV